MRELLQVVAAANKVIGRIGGTLAASQKAIAAVIQNSFHGFVSAIRLEDAVGLARCQIKAIHEWFVAGGRRAKACQQNGIARLEYSAAFRQ